MLWPFNPACNARGQRRVTDHHNDIDHDGRDAKHHVLHQLRFLRQDELWEQSGKKNYALGVGQINKDRAFEQAAARLRIRHGIQIDSTRRAPLLDTQPNQIGRSRPLQHLKCDHRT